MSLQLLSELFPVILSSAGLSGSVFACILAFAVKKAKNDAERKRDERLKLEILRLEGEEKLSELLFEMLRSGNLQKSDQLDEKIHAYSEYLEKSRCIKNRIIGEHTFD
ncbi:MAG: hypothetical protein IKT34_02130 [Clostridia bacterium]|nr:hypothetical protein [Clostridia bacterium]